MSVAVDPITNCAADPTFEKELITAPLAKEMLEKNGNNRPYHRLNLKRIENALRSGDFKYNCETIKLDKHGNLLDGQHRLKAIANTGISAYLLVCRGVDPEVGSTIDRGDTRRVRDWFKMKGYTNHKDLAQATKLVAAFFQGELEAVNNLGSFEPTMAEGMLVQHPELVELSKADPKTYRIGYVSGGTSLFFKYIFGTINEAATLIFFEKWQTGVDLGKHHPVLQLRERLAKNRGDSKKDKMTPSAQYGVIIKAWNAFQGGKLIKSLRVASDEIFPVVAGILYKEGVPQLGDFMVRQWSKKTTSP